MGEAKGVESFNGDGPWCLIGDFHVVRDKEEKRGAKGVLINDSTEIKEFNSFIDDMNLFDIPLLGKHFTWFSSSRNAVSHIDMSCESIMFISMAEFNSICVW